MALPGAMTGSLRGIPPPPAEVCRRNSAFESIFLLSFRSGLSAGLPVIRFRSCSFQSLFFGYFTSSSRKPLSIGKGNRLLWMDSTSRFASGARDDIFHSDLRRRRYSSSRSKVPCGVSASGVGLPPLRIFPAVSLMSPAHLDHSVIPRNS